MSDAPGHYVRLDVIDNGVGMDRATQARIFDPFFTTKEAGQGTGLGLATVFGIVKQSGGYVWVESAPGEGSAFSVYLPRAKRGARPSGPVTFLEAGGDECILLVEDEDAVRRVARRALELHGYTIIEAADGPSALALAAENDIDLVLSDVMMPGMLGPTLAAELRRRNRDIPVLFMSGHTDEIMRDGLLDPSTPFLAKPFTPAQLAQKVAPRTLSSLGPLKEDSRGSTAAFSPTNPAVPVPAPVPVQPHWPPTSRTDTPAPPPTAAASRASRSTDSTRSSRTRRTAPP